MTNKIDMFRLASDIGYWNSVAPEGAEWYITGGLSFNCFYKDSTNGLMWFDEFVHQWDNTKYGCVGDIFRKYGRCERLTLIEKPLPEVKSEVLPKVEQPQFTIPKKKLTVDDIKDHIFEYAKQENIPAHKVVEVLDILIGLEN